MSIVYLKRLINKINVKKSGSSYIFKKKNTSKPLIIKHFIITKNRLHFHTPLTRYTFLNHLVYIYILNN